jgi:hypothetical protein
MSKRKQIEESESKETAIKKGKSTDTRIHEVLFRDKNSFGVIFYLDLDAVERVTLFYTYKAKESSYDVVCIMRETKNSIRKELFAQLSICFRRNHLLIPIDGSAWYHRYSQLSFTELCDCISSFCGVLHRKCAGFILPLSSEENNAKHEFMVAYLLPCLEEKTSMRDLFFVGDNKMSLERSACIWTSASEECTQGYEIVYNKSQKTPSVLDDYLFSFSTLFQCLRFLV